jgi:hypothetical protein
MLSPRLPSAPPPQMAFQARVEQERQEEESHRKVQAHAMPKFDHVFAPQPSNKVSPRFPV